VLGVHPATGESHPDAIQVVLVFTPLQTGLGLLPLEFVFVVVGPLSGMLSDKYGPWLFATLGLSISSAAFFWLAGVNPATSYQAVTVTFLLLGTASAGLAILLTTTAIPYDTLSSLLKSRDSRAFGAMPEQAFVNGFRTAAFVLACIITLAVIPSPMRSAEANRSDT